MRCTFTYDAYGQRTRKHYQYLSKNVSLEHGNPTYITDYTYDHMGRLIRETCVETKQGSSTTHTHNLVYLYDESKVIGVMYGYDTSTLQAYYYHRNAFGDVISIHSTDGTKAVEYAYDAYGNCTVISQTNANLARYNPIRYRGYYYDRETGLYYLNARYYNPEWRRFISPDEPSYLDAETINGLNLYAYCGNDPVNFVDPSGNSAVLIGMIIGAIAGATIGFATAAYMDYQDDSQIFNGSIAWYDYLGATVFGGAIGAVAGYLGASIFPLNIPTNELLQIATTEGLVQTVVVINSTGITIAGASAMGAALAGLGIMFFSKPDSGRIRFSDGTGTDPLTGKPVTDPKRAHEIYRSLNDPMKKANWRKWMKGKGWRTHHLK